MILRSAVLVLLVLFTLACSDSSREQRPAPAPPPPLKITQFYASAEVVAPGEPVLLCYGVENASAVRIEPGVEPIRPLYNRCVQVKPRSTVRYTFIATGVDGREARQSVNVIVRAAARPARAPQPTGLIAAFVASATETGPGGPVTLCYELREPRPVRLDPGPGELPAADRKCVNVRPARTTTYTLRVEGAEADQAELTIRVR